MPKVFIAFDLLEVQLRRRAFARLLENRLQVNAALCGDEPSFSLWFPSNWCLLVNFESRPRTQEPVASSHATACLDSFATP